MPKATTPREFLNQAIVLANEGGHASDVSTIAALALIDIALSLRDLDRMLGQIHGRLDVIASNVRGE